MRRAAERVEADLSVDQPAGALMVGAACRAKHRSFDAAPLEGFGAAGVKFAARRRVDGTGTFTFQLDAAAGVGFVGIGHGDGGKQ